MAQPNGLNPTFTESVTALGFKALHGKGVMITAITCVGTTPQTVFLNPVGFYGTITGMFLVTLGATAQVVTLAGTAGTVSAPTSSNSSGGMVGGAVSNTALTPTSTLQLSSASASDTSIVFITYKITE